MASIVIEDLEQDSELDSQAMKDIFGGRRNGGSLLGQSSISLGGQFASRARFEESTLIPELIRVTDLRKLG